MVEEFIRERTYLKGVSPNTLLWYRDSFKAFQGATHSKAAIVQRISELMQRGVKPISINTYLRCINAYLRWLHLENSHDLVKIPKLKEEQKVLATFSPEHVKALLTFKPKGKNQSRAHATCCRSSILACGSLKLWAFAPKRSISTTVSFESLGRATSNGWCR